MIDKGNRFVHYKSTFSEILTVEVIFEMYTMSYLVMYKSLVIKLLEIEKKRLIKKEIISF